MKTPKNKPEQQLSDNLSEEELLAYLKGSLSKQRQREIEELFSDNTPEADAIEGLQMMQRSDALRSTRLLQQKLHTEIIRGKKHRSGLSTEYWSWIAIVTVLLLIVVGYIVVRIAS